MFVLFKKTMAPTTTSTTWLLLIVGVRRCLSYKTVILKHQEVVTGSLKTKKVAITKVVYLYKHDCYLPNKSNLDKGHSKKKKQKKKTFVDLRSDNLMPDIVNSIVFCK